MTKISRPVAWLVGWVGLVTRHAAAVLAALLVATTLLGWVAITQFKINADLSQLITQKADWRVDFDRFLDEFPDLVRTSVIVVDSPSLKQLELASAEIVAYLEARPEVFRSVAAPGAERFFRDHALLYMDLDALDDTADRLAQAQPWLSAVAHDPSLRGVMDIVADALANSPPEDFGAVLDLLSASAEEAATGGDATIWWTDEFFPLDEARYQLVYAQAAVDANGVSLTDEVIVTELRKMVTSLDLAEGVRVRLTGEVPLQHEEIEAAVGGVAMAGWLALVLLLLVLVLGVRSGKIILATFAMLAIGVVWTSAYAMLTVGEYNTLSVVFIVMFFGLGVDFALHFSLRFQEAINLDHGGADVRVHTQEALVESARSVGRAISLCTLTTALGFLGFWPTDYQGLADLGVISAGGMVIAWFLTFTFLPAFYALAGPPRFHQMDLPTSDRIVHWLIDRRTAVIVGVFGLAIGAAGVAWQSSFDYSVLALKDPQSESMRTLRILQAEGLSTDYQLYHLGGADEHRDVVGTLEALPAVKEVRLPSDRVPSDQDDKLFVLEELQLMLFDALDREAAPPAVAVEDSRAAVTAIAQTLAEDDEVGGVSGEQVARFARALRGMAEQPDGHWRAWERGVVDNLLEELEWIERALSVGPIRFEDLPAGVRSRLVAPSGLELAEVIPGEDIAPVAALSRFLTGVRSVLPSATGRPVLEWGVGGIVVTAFKEALVFAVVAISIVLVIALRRVRTVLLVLYPLTLAAVFTLALGHLIDMPLNMASILVLPLIFGLGVDNGIHVVDRYLGDHDVDQLLHSSTPRAVLLSTMTTIGAFAALSLSPHAGTASIGLLLTISVGFLLVFTIFLLPVLLSTTDDAPREGSGEAGA